MVYLALLGNKESPADPLISMTDQTTHLIHILKQLERPGRLWGEIKHGISASINSAYPFLVFWAKWLSLPGYLLMVLNEPHP